jgi:DNA uptake protein ComE-like DNA-binding protein
VLWSIAVLSLLAGGLSFSIRQNLVISNISRDRLTAHWAARAGVERVIAEIMDDSPQYDTPDDLWYDDSLVMKDIELAGGTFSVFHGGDEGEQTEYYGASDENAKLNINSAKFDQLMELPEMTSSIASAIIDWRDANTTPETEGVEGAHYSNQPHPYMIRNGPFRTVRELLLVRYVTEKLFYGEDTNVNGLLDPNEDDGDASHPPDNADARLDLGWYAYVTVYSYEKNENGKGEKRIKLNEADANKLSRRLNLEKWAAESIVKASQGRGNNGFQHLVDLLDVKRNTSESSSPDDDINERSEEEQDQPVTTSIFQRIVDDLTLSDKDVLLGRININTAPKEVLKTLPGVDDGLAAAIIRDRIGSMGGYTSIGKLLDVSGMTKEKFAEIEQHITVRSMVFRIHSHGYADSGLANATIECIVDRGDKDMPKILYWLESSP